MEDKDKDDDAKPAQGSVGAAPKLTRAQRKAEERRKRKAERAAAKGGGGSPGAKPKADQAEADDEDEDDAEAPPAKVAPRVEPPRKTSGKLAGAAPEVDTRDLFIETAKTGMDWLRERWQLVVAGLLVVCVVLGLVIWRVEASRERDAEAWKKLGEIQPEESSERLATVLGEVAGTSVEPFVALRHADRLSAEGRRDEALKAYERILDEHGDNAFVARLARQSLDVLRAAHSFDASKYAEPKYPRIEKAPGLKPLPPPPPVPPAEAPKPEGEQPKPEGEPPGPGGEQPKPPAPAPAPPPAPAPVPAPPAPAPAPAPGGP